MSNVVNLNKFRKKKLREAKVKQADINRIRHGRTKAEKEGELAERVRLTRLVEGHKLDRTPAEPASEPTTESTTPSGSDDSDSDADSDR